MKYKHFRLLGFEEQKEYRHNQAKFVQAALLILIMFFLNCQNYLYGYLGFYTLFSLIIIGLSIWQDILVILNENKFGSIARKKQKALKELE